MLGSKTGCASELVQVWWGVCTREMGGGVWVGGGRERASFVSLVCACAWGGKGEWDGGGNREGWDMVYGGGDGVWG